LSTIEGGGGWQELPTLLCWRFGRSQRFKNQLLHVPERVVPQAFPARTLLKLALHAAVNKPTDKYFVFCSLARHKYFTMHQGCGFVKLATLLGIK
jgi:hypothetical protein